MEPNLAKTKFTYGDAVHILSTAIPKEVAGKCGDVVGLASIRNEEESVEFGQPVGTILYNIEIGSDDALYVAEKYLEPFRPEHAEQGDIKDG